MAEFDTYAKLHATGLLRMGYMPVLDKNLTFEEGETKVLPLTERVEEYADNSNVLEILDTADSPDKLRDEESSTAQSSEQSEAEQEEAEDNDESEADTQGYRDRLLGVDGVGDSTADQIEEVAEDADELRELLESEDVPFRDEVTENLRKEFL